jgi:AcrR family transcriptional regulator
MMLSMPSHDPLRRSHRDPVRGSILQRTRTELRLQQQIRDQMRERVHELVSARRRAQPLDVVWMRMEEATPRVRREVDRIVDAAIDVADVEGLDALSMRRLAKELDTGTTSLYRYVTDKDELLELMVDAVNADVEFPEELLTDWRRAFEAVSRGARQQMLDHPWLAAQIASRPSIGPNTLRMADAVLGIAAGMAPDLTSAGAIVGSLLRYVHGAVAAELAELEAQRRTGMTENEWRDSIAPYVRAVLDTGRHPAFRAVAIEGRDLSAEEQFEFGLARLLDGFERIARPASPTGL